MTEQLKPCPFCGGDPKTTERPDNIDGTRFFYAVACYCDGYSACAHKMAVEPTPEQAKHAAIEAWNRRAQPAQAVPKTVKFSTKGCNPEDLFDFSAWVPLLSDAEVDAAIPRPTTFSQSEPAWNSSDMRILRTTARAIEQAVRAKMLGKEGA